MTDDFAPEPLEVADEAAEAAAASDANFDSAMDKSVIIDRVV